MTTLDCKACPQTRANGQELKSVLLRFPHGLGDAVALTAVLSHLAQHRPEWVVDVATSPQYTPLLEGKVRHVLGGYADIHDRDYDEAIYVRWREGRGNRDELLPTKSLRCLVEELNVEPRRDLLRWSVTFSDEARKKAEAFLATLPSGKGHVAVHAAGAAWGADQRDIPQADLGLLQKHLLNAGYVPFMLPGQMEVDVLAAVLSLTALNVCVDSGPQKLAYCVPTPLLCVWRKTSPAHYVDCPEQHPKALHLVSHGHEQYLRQSAGVDRECDADALLSLFQRRFRYEEYGELGLALCRAADRLLERPTPSPAPAPRKLLLHSGLCPGDIMTMTAAVEMLHLQHPTKFVTAVSTPQCQAIWENNPHVVPNGDGFEYIDMQYHAVNESGNRPVHFIEGYAEFLAQHLGVPVRMETNRPHLYLSDDEKRWMNQVWEVTGKDVPFWLINSGVKRDYPAKQYPFFQRVVDLLADRVRFVQVGKDSDLHPPLKGVINLVGKTSDRALVRLAYWCQGVVTGVSFLMHLAAAFEKPGVVVAGGREPRLWNSYPTMTLLSTVGSLPCCRTGGCWRSRVVRQDDGKDGETCERPMPTELPAGECMTRISPELVAEAVRSYLP